MYLIRFLLRESPKRVFLAALAGGISGAAMVGLLAYVTAALSGEYSGISPLWGFVGLALLMVASDVLATILIVRLGQGVIFKLRSRLSRRILAAPLKKLEELSPPRLLAALTEDVPVITGVIQSLSNVFINMVLVAGCLVYLCWLSWMVFLAVLVLIIAGAGSYQLLSLKAVRSLRASREVRDTLYKHFRALIEGTKELQLHRGRRQAFVKDLLEAALQAVRRHNIAGITQYAYAGAWGQLLTFGVVGFLIFVLPSLSQTEAKVVIGYVLVILYMTGPLDSLLATVPNISRADISLRKVESLGFSLDSEAAPGEEPAEPPPISPWSLLELDGVTHAYHHAKADESFTLGPVSLQIRPGELLFLVGGNGSGKTTLAKLLVGLYRPEEGTIRLDGRPIGHADLEFYRQHFSMVFSDFFLFDELLGVKSPQMESMARGYLSDLHLEHKVKIEKMKLSTTDLSQGQRKRLALLTAYAEDRPIYVFDEWAADQDPVFKEAFYRRLVPDLIRRGKTVIVISHDDRYYDTADRIIKLEDGKLISDQRKEAGQKEAVPRASSGSLNPG